MEYIYITNDYRTARYAEESGVDRIMVDLEIIGKRERQGHLNTVISEHSITDVQKIRTTLTKSKLLVRINPINDCSDQEINDVVDAGADIIMLPMFKTAKEVMKFVDFVKGRVKTILLLETAQALTRIDDILEINGIDEIHIGLNDLHLSLGLDFMFEVLSGGLIEYLSNKIKAKGISFGFGGIARLGQGTLDSSLILSEHYRLGSSLVILSRDFHAHSNSYDELIKSIDLKEELVKISRYNKELGRLRYSDLIDNKVKMREVVNDIVNSKFK